MIAGATCAKEDHLDNKSLMKEPRLTLAQIVELFGLTEAELSQLEGWARHHRELLQADDGRFHLAPVLVALRRIDHDQRQARLTLAG